MANGAKTIDVGGHWHKGRAKSQTLRRDIVSAPQGASYPWAVSSLSPEYIVFRRLNRIAGHSRSPNIGGCADPRNELIPSSGLPRYHR
jgi:hypothetical protein